MPNLERAYAPDIRIRMDYPLEGVKITARDFDKEGVVYENAGVRVTASPVNRACGDSRSPSSGDISLINENKRLAGIAGPPLARIAPLLDVPS